MAKLRERPGHRLEESAAKYIFKKVVGGMDWINLAKDRDRSVALVNAVMNLRVS